MWAIGQKKPSHEEKGADGRVHGGYGCRSGRLKRAERRQRRADGQTNNKNWPAGERLGVTIGWVKGGKRAIRRL